MDLSKCLPETSIGPLNPKLQPDAESSKYVNIQNDMNISTYHLFFFNNYHIRILYNESIYLHSKYFKNI